MNKSNPSFDLSDRSRWIGIIGSRNASEEENKTAFLFAQKCARLGYVIVSGLAKGIDTSAHKGALTTGKTIAIVNTPITQNIYPKENIGLSEQIKKDGCILYPYETKATESSQGGLSHFSKRLIERDMLLGLFCHKIVAVKHEGAIAGGTRYAMNYGKFFGNKIYRLDNDMKLHKNPEVKSGSIWWEPEVDMMEFEKWMNQN